ncbi:MAG: InlB B-repeat-containing protein, partial [Treponema sp.]|nr:InlB B-repeat-containing protein [Treponema sp.]
MFIKNMRKKFYSAGLSIAALALIVIATTCSLEGTIDEIHKQVREANPFTVSFNTDGGTSIPNQTIVWGNKITLPAHPTGESGETFKWWLQKDGTPWDFETYTVKADLTLFADYGTDTSEDAVVFFANGGKIDTEDYYIAETSGHTVSANIPTPPVRTGYYFTEWNSKPDGTGASYPKTSVIDTSPSPIGTGGSIAVYAQWVRIVNIAAIGGITPPVAGATPKTVSAENAQFTGTVTWLPDDSVFAYNTVYTATITLIAKSGFTLQGVAADFFKVTGATANNAADSGVVTAVFTKTGDVPPPSASISGSPVKITGTVPNSVPSGGVEADKTVTINLTNAKVDSDISAVDALTWFSSTVAGFTYEANASAEATSITITITGMPGAISTDNSTITIPAGKIKDKSDTATTTDLTATGSIAYTIGKAPEPTPSAAINGSPIITGTVPNSVSAGGVPASTTVTIDLTNAKVDSDISAIDASGWFSSKVTGLTYEATASEDDTSISIAITGMPTAISSSSGVTIKIPAGIIKDNSDTTITTALTATGTVTYNIGKAPEPGVVSAAISGSPLTIPATIPSIVTGSGGIDADTTVTINLTNATVNGVLAANAGTWFSTQVAGLTYSATAADNANAIIITIAGTPDDVSTASVTITIPAGIIKNDSGVSTTAGVAATGSVTYAVTQALEPITAVDLGIAVPVTGEYPTSVVNVGTGYTGTITWTDVDASTTHPIGTAFAAGKEYHANINLTAAANYTFTGLIGSFTNTAGGTVVPPGVVTATTYGLTITFDPTDAGTTT